MISQDYFSHILTGMFEDVMAGPSLGIFEPDPPGTPRELTGMVIPYHRLRDILVLLRTVWGDVPRDRWAIDVLPVPGQKLIQIDVELDDRYAIRMSIGKDATTVMMIDRKPPSDVGLQARSIERMALRNECWQDFVGWVSLSRTVYDEELRSDGRVLRVF